MKAPSTAATETVIVVVPTPIAVTLPEASTVAIASLFEVKEGVADELVVVVRVSVAPTKRLRDVGLTVKVAGTVGSTGVSPP